MRMGAAGWNNFTPVFLPWYFDPRNRIPMPPNTELDDNDADEFGNEVELKELYDLDNEQLEWRRAAIRKQPAGVRRKLHLFQQEHPGTQSEAWLFAFGKYVEHDTILKLRSLAEEKKGFWFQGDMEHRRDLGKDHPFRRWAKKRPLGPLTIWERPRVDREYIIGADVAEGLADGDFSCAKVYMRHPAYLKLVAEWWGHCSTDIFANIMWRLGWHFASRQDGGLVPAMLAWERTGPGAGIHGWLRSGNMADPTDSYPGGRQYRTMTLDKKKLKRDQKYGIPTTRMGKRPMLDMWVEWARDGAIDVIHADVDEADSLELDDRGIVDTGGKDRFMASVMAVYAHRTQPLLAFTEETKEDEPEFGTVAWADRIIEKGDEMRREREAQEEAVLLWSAPE
jgi:hypothetical protein